MQDEVLYLANAAAVVAVLTEQRKPAVYPHTAFARVGGLLSLAVLWFAVTQAVIRWNATLET